MAKKSIVKKKKKPAVMKKAVAKKPNKKVIKKVVKKAIKKGAKKTVKKAIVKRKKVLAIPKGYNSITAYLTVDHAAKAIDFYKKAFGAKEVMRMEHSDGKIGHAELKIGDTKIMLSDECPEMDARSPKAYGGSPISIYLYVKNVDDTVDKAVSAGAKLKKPVENMFYGDRSGMVEDPYGHHWHVATHIEDVSKAKQKKRATELFSKK